MHGDGADADTARIHCAPRSFPSGGPGRLDPHARHTVSGESGLTLPALVLRRLLLILLLLAALLARILRIARLCVGLLRIAHVSSLVLRKYSH